MGRPTSLTPEVERRILSALRGGNYREAAAQAGGVHRHTLRNWIVRGEAGEEPYAAFLAAVEKAEAFAERRLLKLIKVGLEGWQSKAWIMERRWPSRWGGRVRSAVNDELAAIMKRIEEKLDPETFAKVVDATREDAPGASPGSTRH